MSASRTSDVLASAGFLAECEPLGAFCKRINISQRTGLRLRNQPDGLPVVEIGRKLLVHIPSADAWAKRRMRQRNPIRRGRSG